MHKDTIISKGSFRFVTNNDKQDYEVLVSLATVIKDFLNRNMDITAHNRFRDEGNTSHYEGRVFSCVNERDIVSFDLSGGQSLDYYIHAESVRIHDAIDYLKYVVNENIGLHKDELDGLAMVVKEYRTTFNGPTPRMVKSQISVIFEYDEIGGYRLVIDEKYNLRRVATPERLRKHTELFVFSPAGGDACIERFLRLVSLTIYSPSRFSEEFLLEPLERKMSELIINSIINEQNEDWLDVRPITRGELKEFFFRNMRVNLTIGPAETLSEFEKVIPKMSKNLMLYGGINW